MSNKQMTASTSVRIRMDDVKVFGPGIAELLERIDRCESIRTATMEMKRAYSKAWTMLRSCAAALGYPLIQRKVGGAGGGGSTLTPEGRSCWRVTARGRPTAKLMPRPTWLISSRRPPNESFAGCTGCWGFPALWGGQ